MKNLSLVLMVVLLSAFTANTVEVKSSLPPSIYCSGPGWEIEENNGHYMLFVENNLTGDVSMMGLTESQANSQCGFICD